jgi:hypothetical protein
MREDYGTQGTHWTYKVGGRCALSDRGERARDFVQKPANETPPGTGRWESRAEEGILQLVSSRRGQIPSQRTAQASLWSLCKSWRWLRATEEYKVAAWQGKVCISGRRCLLEAQLVSRFFLWLPEALGSPALLLAHWMCPLSWSEDLWGQRLDLVTPSL